MTNLLSRQIHPTPAGYTAEPFTPVEIDQHPDSARIWATVLAMRQEVEVLLYDEPQSDGYVPGI